MYYLDGDVTSASSLGGPVTCFTGSLINLPRSQWYAELVQVPQLPIGFYLL